MKIAIIGGGASGMVLAYLLDRQGHSVTVYEWQSTLGGHIRTLNGNIQARTDCPERLETGVLEFSAKFTNFLALMKDLAVPLAPVEVGSGLFFKDGSHLLSPAMIDRNFRGVQKWREFLHLEILYAQSLGLWLKTHRARLEDLAGQPLSKYFSSESDRTTWLKLLTMYSYSMPYEAIDNFPAALAIPSLCRYIFGDWYRIKGGVYSYIEKILSKFSGEVYLGTTVTSVRRSDEAVQIEGKGRNAPPFAEQFDKVVFATPPDQILSLLEDARPDEVRRFQAWKPNYITTVLHSDRALYKPYNITRGAEFDFFQTNAGWGYNAYLNQLCGITSEQSYSLAFNLEKAISPEKIIHTQQHHTPFYDADSFRYRDEVIATNGENNTYHAGAYLSDGLHEGAVTSAMAVAEAIAATASNDPVRQSQPQLVA